MHTKRHQGALRPIRPLLLFAYCREKARSLLRAGQTPTEIVVLTLAIVFLILAVIAGVFSIITVGPAGVILFVVFMALFVWMLLLHRRERSANEKKAAHRATSYSNPWKDARR